MKFEYFIVQFYFDTPEDLSIADVYFAAPKNYVVSWSLTRLWFLQLVIRRPGQPAPRLSRVLTPDGAVIAEDGPLNVWHAGALGVPEPNTTGNREV